MASSFTGNSNHIRTSVPTFIGELYDFWADKMETFLRSQDLWDIVENEPVSKGKNVDGTPVKLSKDDSKRDAYALH